MSVMDPAASTLLVIDLQARLVPAIEDGDGLVREAARLVAAAAMLAVPAVFTEQNPSRLGATVAGVPVGGAPVLAKMSFDACAAPGFLDALAPGHALVVAGCEAHVCVLQTVLGLLARSRQVFVVRDAVGSRRSENRLAALERMARAGAEIVTTEMVVFEWLRTAEHPRFRELSALIK